MNSNISFQEDKLKSILGPILSVDPATITSDLSKDTVADWDSLKHMNLILALEEEFGVVIPDEDAANLTSYPLIKLVLQDLLGKEK